MAEAVAMAVAGVAIVIVVVSTAAAIGERVPSTADATEVVIRYASNPLTWIVIYGGGMLLSAAVGRLRSSS